MPFINMKTNVAVNSNTCEELKKNFGEAIADIPGKSERWLMVDIEGERTMYFAGSSEATCMVEVSIFGTASDSALAKLTGHITDIVNKALGVSPDRIYVKYMPIDHWGWNGGNF